MTTLKQANCSKPILWKVICSVPFERHVHLLDRQRAIQQQWQVLWVNIFFYYGWMYFHYGWIYSCCTGEYTIWTTPIVPMCKIRLFCVLEILPFSPSHQIQSGLQSNFSLQIRTWLLLNSKLVSQQFDNVSSFEQPLLMRRREEQLTEDHWGSS